jgi:CheY-like chemotaxis protein
VTWLLVEDDPDIRNIIQLMMTVWGEQPLVFPEGNSAWAWLERVAGGMYQGELPELALMDIRMPGPNGDKLAARMRQIAALKDIPIVLMTAFALTDTEIRVMTEQSGIDYFLNKPLPDLDVFRSLLYEVRDKKRLRRTRNGNDTSHPVNP